MELYSHRSLLIMEKKEVVVLKPKKEFLVWAIPHMRFKHTLQQKFRKKSAFQLFRMHFLKAMKHIDTLHPQTTNMEIIEAWNNADNEVRLEYEKFANEFFFFKIVI